jgi:Mn2+/Fe2+ NRAMP family transporter
LVVVALGVGNSAYQSGNLTGAGLGIAIALDVPVSAIVGFAAVMAGALILVNRYDWLEKSLSLLVALMGVVFVGLAIALFPEFATQTANPTPAQFNALAPESITLTLALIGTTVVPYNLFLHAAAVNKRWSGADVDQSIAQARADAVGSIMVGGLVTAAIVIVGAVLVSDQSDATAFAQLITAVDDRYGLLGRYAMGVGLFAAGLTSAIAAPVAGGWAVCGALGWSTAPGSAPFRGVALGILLVGTFFALFADRPIALILSAQVTNALILPLMALLLLLVINNTRVPQKHRNTTWSNVLGALIMISVTTLALAKLWRLWN